VPVSKQEAKKFDMERYNGFKSQIGLQLWKIWVVMMWRRRRRRETI
jgi:hypothetical protein